MADMEKFKDEMLESINSQFQKMTIPTNSQNGSDALVAALFKHIEFLQGTITSLINKQTSTNIPLNQHPTTTLISSNTSPNVPSAAPSSSPPQSQPEKPAVKPPLKENPTPQQKAKKQVLIFGDSMLNAIDEKELRRHAFVRVRNHPGATVEDLKDHLRAHTRHVKHDAIIIMAGTNDITLNNSEENKGKPKRDTSKHLQELIQLAKENSTPGAHVAVCQVTARKDKQGIMKDVIDLNQKFRHVAQQEQIGFVSTGHFLTSHTGKKGIHPNESGLDVIYNTLEKYVYKVARI